MGESIRLVKIKKLRLLPDLSPPPNGGHKNLVGTREMQFQRRSRAASQKEKGNKFPNANFGHNFLG